MLSEKFSHDRQNGKPIRQIKFENEDGVRFRFLVSGDMQDMEKLNSDQFEAYMPSKVENIVAVFIKKHADYDDDYTPGTHPGFNMYETFCKMERLLGPIQTSKSFIDALSELEGFEEAHPTFEGTKQLVTELRGRAQQSLDLDEALARQLQERTTKLDKQYDEDEAMARQLQQEYNAEAPLFRDIKKEAVKLRESQQSDPAEKNNTTLEEPKHVAPRN
jgi:hypothetical protein